MNLKTLKQVGALLLAIVMMLSMGSALAASAEWNGFTVTTNGEYQLIEYEDETPRLFVEEGANVTIKANYLYNPTGTLENGWYFYNWDTDESGQVAENADSYTFTYQHPGNLSFYASDSATGNVVDQSIYIETLVSEVQETYFFSANEEVSLWFYAENFGHVENVQQYLIEKFIRDWNSDGELTADELNQNVTVKWTSDFVLGDETTTFFKDTGDGYIRPGELLAELGAMKASDDGKQVTLTLENKNGDKFTLVYTFEYNNIAADYMSATSEQEIEVEKSHNVTLRVTADKGTPITFRDNSRYEGNKNLIPSYQWSFYSFDEGEVRELDCTSRECTITVEEDGELICDAIYTDEDGYYAYVSSFASIEVKGPEVTFRVVTIPAVVNESNDANEGTIVVNEGETVTIHTNATSSLPDAKIGFFWSIDTIDEEGNLVEEAVQEGVGATFSFVADKSLDGKKVYAWGGLAEIEDFTGDYLYYDLKVLPKSGYVYKTEYVSGIPASAISEALKAIPELNTADKIEAAMEINVLAQAAAAGMKIDAQEKQTAVYDVTLMYSEDGGKTFVQATKDNWPVGGITVTLPYPAGTGMHTHNFVAAHMFTETTAKHRAGDIEYPVVTNTPNGITFVVDGLSPIAVAWDEKPAVVPSTGDNATPYLWMLGMAIAAIGCAVLVGKRRQHN